MSSLAATQPLTDTPLENGRLYHSEWGLLDFQGDAVTEGLLRSEGLIFTMDTGTGKSHVAMCLASIMREDDDIDLVLLVCEQGKVGEWKDEFLENTAFNPVVYHGKDRRTRLANNPTRVLISTYETIKRDVCEFTVPPGKRKKVPSPGPLLPFLLNRRCVVIYDESVKLRNRGSANYQAHEFMVTQLRKSHPGTRVFGLTATPMEKEPEDFFNQARIVCPSSMPTVGYFEDTYTRGRDDYFRLIYRPETLHDLYKRFLGPAQFRKRKTDPDVMAQFPKQVETARHFELTGEHKRFYEMVRSLGDPPEDATDEEKANWEPPPGLWTVLRQVAGHPASLLYSRSEIAQIVVAGVGEDYLRSVPSTKTVGLVEELKALVLGEDQKVVAFTFFGQSIIPLVWAALNKVKIPVVLHHGGMTQPEKRDAQVAFRTSEKPMVFLTSDAGSRGINLPEASYVYEYESALTHANRTQRINRIHRIDSTFPSVTARTFFLDGTVEEIIGRKMLKTNEWSDVLLGDEDAGEGFITAADRKEMLELSRSKVRSLKGRK